MIESKTHLFPPPPCDESARVVASPTSGCAGCCPLLTSGCAAGCPARLWGCAHCCQPMFWGCSSRCPVCKHCLGFGSWAPLPPERYPCWGRAKAVMVESVKSLCCWRPFYLVGGLVLSSGPHCCYISAKENSSISTHLYVEIQIRAHLNTYRYQMALCVQ